MMLTEVGGEVTPDIGFPTEGLSAVPIFPEGRVEGVPESSAGAPVVPVPPLLIPPVAVIPPVDLPPDLPPEMPPVEPPIEPPVVIPPVEPPVEPPIVLPPVEPPVDHGVELSGGALSLDEAHLCDGSASDPAALTQNGTFSVSAPDGLQSLVVGGLIIIDGGVIAGFPQTTQTPLGNTFSVTHYDAASGLVSYSYTLAGATTHADGDGTNLSGETIEVTAQDADGDAGSSTLQISIIDDVPVAALIDLTASTELSCDGVSPVATWGSLLDGGTFGADGGFVSSICFNGVTYSYDPQSGLSVSPGAPDPVFDPVTHVLFVTGDDGSSLAVNMLTGVFGYTPSPDGSGAPLTETIGYVISDNDHDLASAELVIHVPGNPVVDPQGPTAVADHVITNVLAPSIEVPSALLVANDVSANGDPLSATPTVFNTVWQAAGEGFSNDCLKTLDFTGHSNKPGNQLNNLQRSDFFNAGNLTALVVLNGYLGADDASAANAQDLYSVNLKAGETVSIALGSSGDTIGVGWQSGEGDFQLIDANGTFTATEDGVYRLLLVNQPDEGEAHHSVDYSLTLTIDYSAVDNTPTYESLYTVNDAHGGSDSAALTISYQEGCTLLGTTGDDVLLGGNQDDNLHGGDGNDVLSGGAGDNILYGDNGNDILFSGAGNDVLDGGAGNNTVSYELASSGVSVSTGDTDPQDTGGAGVDTLIDIQNLIGSNFDDHLTGDYEANVISGGLGNDVLIGGLGNDTLTGGGDSDTFKWLAGDMGHDLVTDFSIGADTLDLSKLLQGLGAGADSLDDVLHFKVTGSGDTLVSTIEIGSAQTIDLAGVDLANHYGVTAGAGGMVAGGADTASIITGMLGDHSMRADV
jgi:Ca2+-binding RTX toxin-like protein